MGITPKLSGLILRMHDRGRDPVSIACELMCDYCDVVRVIGTLDMVDHAIDVAAAGGRPVLEARDTAEAASLTELSAGLGIRVERRNVLKSSRAKARVDAVAVPDQAQAATAERVSRPAGGRSPAATSERMGATAGRDRHLEQDSPDGCQLGEGDSDGSTLDPSEPSDRRGGHRGRTRTPPEVGRTGKPAGKRAAELESVTSPGGEQPGTHSAPAYAGGGAGVTAGDSTRSGLSSASDPQPAPNSDGRPGSQSRHADPLNVAARAAMGAPRLPASSPVGAEGERAEPDGGGKRRPASTGRPARFSPVCARFPGDFPPGGFVRHPRYPFTKSDRAFADAIGGRRYDRS